nr:hypothetical protein Itr_chr03CG24830 [Ipomoea trifida]
MEWFTLKSPKVVKKEENQISRTMTATSSWYFTKSELSEISSVMAVSSSSSSMFCRQSNSFCSATLSFSDPLTECLCTRSLSSLLSSPTSSAVNS